MKHILFTIIAFLSAYSSAYANECTDYIQDEVGAADISAIEGAVKDMRGAGIEPRVRVIKTYDPHGNLDRFERAWLLRCPEMQSADNGKKGNLVTMIIEMDHRQIGVYYGPDYDKPLKSSWKGIKDHVVIPRLKAGEFDRAITGGLRELTSEIYGYELSLRENPQEVPPAPDPVNAKPPEEIAADQERYIAEQAQLEAEAAAREKEIELRVALFKRFLLFTVGLLFVFLLYKLLSKLVGNMRKAREERERLAEAVRIARGELDDISPILEGLQHEEDRAAIKDDLDSIRESVCEPEYTPFEIVWERLLNNVPPLLEDQKELDDTDINKETPERIEILLADYAALKVPFEKQLEVLRGFHLSMKRKLSEVEKAPQHERITQTAVDMNIGKVDDIVDAGYAVSEKALRLREQAETCIDKASEALQAKAYTSFYQMCEVALEDSQDSLAAAQVAEKHVKDLMKTREQLKEELTQTKSLRERSEASFERVSNYYSHSSWKDCEGHGSQGDKYLKMAEEKLKGTSKTLSAKSKAKTLKATEQSFIEISSVLEEAANLFRDVLEKEKSLVNSKRLHEEEIAAAEKDIETTLEYIEQHRSKMDEKPLLLQLQKAETVLKQAKSEAKKEKPNYLLVVRKALKANAEADAVFALATTEKENQDRKNRLARTSLSEAKDAIQSAQRYLRSHNSDVNMNSKTALSEAQSFLSRITTLSNLDTIIRLSREAERQAQESLKKAQRSVRAAESRRESARREQAAANRRARERRQRSYTSSSSSFGGGGSSSFGGSSFGGGGSSGW